MGKNNGNPGLVFEIRICYKKKKTRAYPYNLVPSHLINNFTRLSAIPMYYILEMKLKIEESLINFYKWSRFHRNKCLNDKIQKWISTMSLKFDK